MRDILQRALSVRYPAMKPNMLVRYVDKYIAGVMHEIATQYMHVTSDDLCQGEMDFAANAVSNACGRMEIAGSMHYIYSVMQQHSSTSLIVRTYKGNSITHRVSRVCFNPKYKKDIMEALGNMSIECNPQNLRDLQSIANNSVEIDPESLASYIQQTTLTLNGHHSEAYKEKLTRNLLVANQLVWLTKHDGDVAYLDEYWEQIDSGRIHGHGLSLQRIPKQVRHAALGPCYRYDLKAASYALLTSLALQFDPTLKVAALKEYITHRAPIRKRIALDIGVSEEWMKSIFTSMGFGAELRDNPFSSIRKQLGPEKYQKLLCNAEFMDIKKQLDSVTKTITKFMTDGDFDLHGMHYCIVNPKDDKKRNTNQKLAWLYQCMESHAMGVFLQTIPDNYKVKLMVHDCIYLDRPLTAHHVADIAYKLRLHYALLSFEGDAIVPIHASGFVGTHDRQVLQDEDAHRARIVAEAAQAASYRSPHIDGNGTLPKRMVQTPWGDIKAAVWVTVAQHGAKQHSSTATR